MQNRYRATRVRFPITPCFSSHLQRLNLESNVITRLHTLDRGTQYSGMISAVASEYLGIRLREDSSGRLRASPCTRLPPALLSPVSTACQRLFLLPCRSHSRHGRKRDRMRMSACITRVTTTTTPLSLPCSPPVAGYDVVRSYSRSTLSLFLPVSLSLSGSGTDVLGLEADGDWGDSGGGGDADGGIWQLAISTRVL